MSFRSFIAIFIALILGFLGWISFRGCSREKKIIETIVVEPAPVAFSTATVALSTVPVIMEPKVEKKKPVPIKEEITTSKAPPTPVTVAPPVELHRELIPKNIEIVRVYYSQSLGSPGASIEFDINGSGFNEEFGKMIQVESGHSLIKVQNLILMTPNQIHGTLIADSKAPTVVSFPKILINKKVVFQSPDPFAIIRPGEVLNVVFTEMGESGRNGRFRIFTNLTPESMSDFRVTASTPVIQIADLTPAFPYVVDGTIYIGPAAGGEYGLEVRLKDNVLWKRDGIIRVVRPNVGQTGLVQRAQALDEYHRPGDNVLFSIQGSGFRPEDARLLSAKADGLEVKNSSFVYIAPGRMELSLEVSPAALPGSYGLQIYQGSELLLGLERIFSIVGKNWMRGFQVDPVLSPGAEATLYLLGRDMDADFISKLKVEVDEIGLKVGKFQWESLDKASTSIRAESTVKPGDYLLHLTQDGVPVTPQFGGVIRISSKQK